VFPDLKTLSMLTRRIIPENDRLLRWNNSFWK